MNSKERLDFSCAVFDAEGRLVANAPHVPVHLGAMGESVRTVIRSRGATLRPGDVVALNNPYNGGTHLPDIVLGVVRDGMLHRVDAAQVDALERGDRLLYVRKASLPESA